MIFIDLSDRKGIVQIVFDLEKKPQAHALAHNIRSELVLAIKGRVNLRPAEMIIPSLKGWMDGLNS
ncbi:MAG: hypothetical protein JRD43_06570 [Deltaproteobacteria bacterium]|nr:hypothetical protein [Deltaproteobacteria bacterium]MBW2595749.1 hypothetical protein [Deltaproteobacteria bacterium]